MSPAKSGRRRFLSVLGVSATCAAMPAVRAAGQGDVIHGQSVPADVQRVAAQAGPRAGMPEPTVWKGTALGAFASITLVHEDRERARRVLDACVDEIGRLERIFSLYRPDSALAVLNTAGTLQAPPAELVELLSTSLALARASQGAFDPTVQPLYERYQAHFARAGADPRGPADAVLAQARRLIDYRRVDISAGRIAFRAPAMAITLNGIAQGYVTDRIADRLREEGFADVVVDLGEARAAGHRADGRPWVAAVIDPEAPARTLFELEMGDAAGQAAALATSAGAGTRFGPDPRVHHLFDPHTGRSANRYASVSVAAPRATLADGLATALSILAPEDARRLLAAYRPARAWFVHGDRTIEKMA